ncbi:MAG: PQQ-dependent sugar dehydrogenase [Candidatus Thiodiazotropha sp.]
MKYLRIVVILITALPLTMSTINSAATTITEKHNIDYEIVMEGLANPWAIAFLPEGGMLITERRGTLRIVDSQGNLEPKPIAGLPAINEYRQGGLLDVALHPKYKENHWVYFSYSEPNGEYYGTTVSRGKLVGRRLEQLQTVFRMARKTSDTRHFGSRLVFDQQGHLFITLGDRGDRTRAQDLKDHAGSVIRINDDGTIPAQNPFTNKNGLLPEIYSYGHRNIQGAALHPESGKLWTHEHGPHGGDEINIPKSGANYGWPIISYGLNYRTLTTIGEGTHKQGLEQPVHYWVPSIAPSGMTFYTGDKFKNWKGNLFVGSLKFQQLVRLELDGETITHEERLLSGKLGRIRDVREGPDGLIYLLTDAENGKLVRLIPTK